VHEHVYNVTHLGQLRATGETSNGAGGEGGGAGWKGLGKMAWSAGLACNV